MPMVRGLWLHLSQRLASTLRWRIVRPDFIRKSGTVSGFVLESLPVFVLPPRSELRMVRARLGSDDRNRSLREGDIGESSNRSLRFGEFQFYSFAHFGNCRTDIALTATSQRSSQVRIMIIFHFLIEIFLWSTNYFWLIILCTFF